jgi:hypothetical protein
MNPDKIIIRFEQVAEQTEGCVCRFVGFVRAKNMLQLFDAADLEANPREPKAGSVTGDIIDSINETPETFPFKTKGILVGASNYAQLQRNRYELRFENTKIEGILDGGHNMLAIGTYVLSKAVGDERVLKRIKNWSDLKGAWADNRKQIEALKTAPERDGDDHPLNFLVPVEVLVPSKLEDDEIVDEFNGSLLDICAARNNNHELTDETKSNKKGFYEELRRALPERIARNIEWKTNDGGTVKVRDIVALAWIPLSAIDLPVPIKVAPPSIYARKGDCSRDFDKLMSNDLVSKPTGGDYTHELHNTSVHSALVIAGQLPALFDRVFKAFPEAYNRSGGRFGSMSIVKMAKDMRSKPTTPFTSEAVEYTYPEGLIMPLVYGFKALMEVDAKGHVRWKESPERFIDENLDAIVKKYRVIIEAFRADPQKIGKNEGSYDLVLDAFETELLRRQVTA